MPFIDTYAADRIREMRDQRGLSPEALAREISKASRAHGWERGSVDAHTIRKIEGTGHVPTTRVRFVVSSYFGLLPHELWEPWRKREVETLRQGASA